MQDINKSQNREEERESRKKRLFDNINTFVIQGINKNQKKEERREE